MGSSKSYKRKLDETKENKPSLEKVKKDKKPKSKKERSSKKDKKSKKSKNGEVKVIADTNHDSKIVAKEVLEETNQKSLHDKKNQQSSKIDDFVIPLDYTYSNTLKIEYSVTKFIEMYRKILETSPTIDIYQEKIKALNTSESDIIPAFSRYKLKLAAEIKSLELAHCSPVLEEINQYETNFDSNNVNPVLPQLTTDIIKSLKLVNKKKIHNSSTKSKTKSNEDDEYYDYSDDEGVKDILQKSRKSGWPPALPEIKNPVIKARVFTHKSMIKDKDFLSEEEKLSTHNERLEFLGDAVLYQIVTKMIYRRFPVFDDGQLSQLRTQLVNNKRLKTFSELYGLKDKLRTNIFMGYNDDYIHGKQKADADVFEAYIGGLVEDDPVNSSNTIEKWLSILMEPTIQEVVNSNVKLESTEKRNFDAKRELYSLIGYAALGLGYKVVKARTKEDPTVIVQCTVGDGTVLGVGSGPNMKIAGAKAAENVLANKPLIEKYANQRAAIPRTQSMAKTNDNNDERNSNRKRSKGNENNQKSGMNASAGGKIKLGPNGAFILG